MKITLRINASPMSRSWSRASHDVEQISRVYPFVSDSWSLSRIASLFNFSSDSSPSSRIGFNNWSASDCFRFRHGRAASEW